MSSFKLVVGVAALIAAGCSFDVSGVSAPGADGGVDPDALGAPDAPPAPMFDAPPADTDGDEVPDHQDNCDQTPNPEQYDEDADGVGDACDNCPARFNPLQENLGDDDEVGDACDPRPVDGGDSIVLFNGFNDPSDLSGWAVGDGSNSWSVQNGTLRQTSTSRTARVIYWGSELLSNAVAETAMRFDDIPDQDGAGDRYRIAGLVANYSVGVDLGTGYACLQYRNLESESQQTLSMLMSLDDSQGVSLADTPVPGMSMNTEYRHELTVSDDPLQRCVLQGPIGAPVTLQGSSGSYASGFVGLRTHSVAASFRYIVIYGLGN